MNCKNCGSKIKESDEFCEYCGTKLKEESIEQPKPEIQFDNNTNTQQNQKTSNTKTFNGQSIAGFILSLFIPLLGLIFSVIGYNRAKKENTSTGLALAGIIISIITWIINIILLNSGLLNGLYDVFIML
ncbi:MAG: zinc ribbon domain-containing protein [Clostridia bacterium]|nr:zinc ribbon domain-containing protein [Clostridia bacterium]